MDADYLPPLTLLPTGPVGGLQGVGPHAEAQLKRLGIETLQDLLFHLPTRYEDRTRITPIGTLRPGATAVIQGLVDLTQVSMGRRRSLLSRISDGTGAITLRFFHFNAEQQHQLARGVRIRCFGEVRKGPNSLEMVHPEYRRIAPDHSLPVEETLTPVYAATTGLNQPGLRKLTRQALRETANLLPEWLPERTLAALNMPTLCEAVQYLHSPPPDAPTELLEDGMHPAQRRLAFEELLARYLSLRKLRAQLRGRPAPALTEGVTLAERFTTQLPFKLTAAQQRVIGEIRRDLADSVPMLRLLQGDVGSGKTVVAAMAVLQAIENGYQVAVMTPTELLAEQHLRTFTEWFEPLEVPVCCLTGKAGRSEREKMLTEIVSGDPLVAIGTHALFQEQVSFGRLGLNIIDEQHRFGVHQRLTLSEKGSDKDGCPHQLIMTATPIPRTLAMTAYADLDTSVIDELPAGRKPVRTIVVPEARRSEVVERIARACEQGRQVYWVCTLIEQSEALQCQAATDTAEELANELPQVDVGLVHGRMKADEKEKVMNAFVAGEIDLLIATTVIEVGVDVPKASLMVIENAERLGMAQLHQLRGRVGRGTEASDCVLMYRPPLSERARTRLSVLRDTNDGFVIAQRDLELRGPGEVLGTRQSGLVQLRIADLGRDKDLLPQVEKVAQLLAARHPENVDPLIQRWLGKSLDYGRV